MFSKHHTGHTDKFLPPMLSAKMAHLIDENRGCERGSEATNGMTTPYSEQIILGIRT
jgi:hypothetical protein